MKSAKHKIDFLGQMALLFILILFIGLAYYDHHSINLYFFFALLILFVLVFWQLISALVNSGEIKHFWFNKMIKWYWFIFPVALFFLVWSLYQSKSDAKIFMSRIIMAINSAYYLFIQWQMIYKTKYNE